MTNTNTLKKMIKSLKLSKNMMQALSCAVLRANGEIWVWCKDRRTEDALVSRGAGFKRGETTAFGVVLNSWEFVIIAVEAARQLRTTDAAYTRLARSLERSNNSLEDGYHDKDALCWHEVRAGRMTATKTRFNNKGWERVGWAFSQVS